MDNCRKGYKCERQKAFDKWFAMFKSKKTTNANVKPKAKTKVKSVRALTMQPDPSDSDFTDDDMPDMASCINHRRSDDGSKCVCEPVTRGIPLNKEVVPPSAKRSAPIEHRKFWQQLAKREKQRYPMANATVRSEADLEKFLSTHPTI